MISDEQLKALRQAQRPEQQPAWMQDEATPRQVSYLTGLVESRDAPVELLEDIKRATEQGLKKGEAGTFISALKQLPVKPGHDDRSKNNPQLRDIPPGRYAVPGAEEGDIHFFRVKDVRGGYEKEGGYRIILRIAGPNEHALSGQVARDAVKAIHRRGLGHSAVLYGRTIGRCSQCNTQITNRLSRELGIGPICGGRVYNDWETRRNRAETAILARGEDPRENVND
jgi:hypothetical protein